MTERQNNLITKVVGLGYHYITIEGANGTKTYRGTTSENAKALYVEGKDQVFPFSNAKLTEKQFDAMINIRTSLILRLVEAPRMIIQAAKYGHNYFNTIAFDHYADAKIYRVETATNRNTLRALEAKGLINVIDDGRICPLVEYTYHSDIDAELGAIKDQTIYGGKVEYLSIKEYAEKYLEQNNVFTKAELIAAADKRSVKHYTIEDFEKLNTIYSNNYVAVRMEGYNDEMVFEKKPSKTDAVEIVEDQDADQNKIYNVVCFAVNEGLSFVSVSNFKTRSAAEEYVSKQLNQDQEDADFCVEKDADVEIGNDYIAAYKREYENGYCDYLVITENIPE